MFGRRSGAQPVPSPTPHTNHTNPPDLTPVIFGVEAALIMAVTIFIAIRLFTKAYVSRQHVLEDYLSYTAWAGVVAHGALEIHLARHGFGRHLRDVRPHQLISALYYGTLVIYVYTVTTLMAKLSVFFQIKRLFVGTKKGVFYWTMWGSIILSVIVYSTLFIGYLVLFNTSCTVKGDRLSISKGCQRPIYIANMSNGIFNFISDLAAILLPGWAVLSLNMSGKGKFKINLVFAVGWVPCSIGVAALFVHLKVPNTNDVTWIGAITGVLVTSDMASITILGCLPSVIRFLQFFREQYGRNSRKYQRTIDPKNNLQLEVLHGGKEPDFDWNGGNQILRTIHIRVSSEYAQIEGPMKGATQGLSFQG